MYATVRELTGLSELEIESDSLSDLLQILSERFGPPFSSIARAGRPDDSVVILVNGQNVTAIRPDIVLSQDDEICIFPPLSGG